MTTFKHESGADAMFAEPRLEAAVPAAMNRKAKPARVLRALPIDVRNDEDSAYAARLHDEVWDLLEQGLRVPSVAAHSPLLITRRSGDLSGRTVSLRGVDRERGELLIHVERTSPLPLTLRLAAECLIEIEDHGRGICVSMDVRPRLHDDDDFAQRHWADLERRARRYGSASLGSELLGELAARDHYLVVTLQVGAIDWRQLRAPETRHARFERGDQLVCRWLDA